MRIAYHNWKLWTPFSHYQSIVDTGSKIVICSPTLILSPMYHPSIWYYEYSKSMLNSTVFHVTFTFAILESSIEGFSWTYGCQNIPSWFITIKPTPIVFRCIPINFYHSTRRPFHFGMVWLLWPSIHLLPPQVSIIYSSFKAFLRDLLNFTSQNSYKLIFSILPIHYFKALTIALQCKYFF
jgi:hypothetical protein